MIQKACETELGNNMQPNEDDLRQLENKVSEVVTAYNGANGGPGSRTGGSRKGGSRAGSKPSSNQKGKTPEGTLASSSSAGALGADPASLLASDWSLLDAYDMLEHQEKQKQKQVL